MVMLCEDVCLLFLEPELLGRLMPAVYCLKPVREMRYNYRQVH